MDALYTASATTSGGGRQGKVTSSDGIIDFSLSMPKGLGGAGGNGTNPEQLFAAGYSACFDSALNLVARQERKKIESEVTAEVSIGKDTDGGFGLSVNMKVDIKGVTQEEAEQLVNTAHTVCPYSKATKGNINVDLQAKAI
ncbi:organic hydroperoxide resistance protein [Jeotgalibacillus marinus]|uniref:Organic hydroperoxide resistance protein n=1 Tax=Jeotgalibacillus marinus TaxID=86667 RepID=A0ABV3Q6B0_9BACL